ncbi:Uncharacterised protein [Mycobacteroides abscessus subsp. abscessus]|uniref:hypothetical protein n=1 Tax=Mycobacteroides abscessus TaxID=36809 RepID=UPI000926F1F1|nr:hypothetical protein [Mycobacteroides abscessus]SII94448.1 Uncharacterised protein [Mycobacteroides abscessus subsp. abscessus]SIL06885.1 Uncharacterised protein [Mycobacteroides abscessus subsp. abscessus]SLK57982.1 Uncharacterised protein [Mycobacteroides abscessus subsp. abscessus]
MSSPVAVIVVTLIAAVAIPGIALAFYGFWECWKTDHRPDYQSPLVHGWED